MVANGARPSEKRVVSNVLRGSTGNLIEWYDWYVYTAFSVYFSQAFFPQGDTTAELLKTAVVFAVGFLMRPFGGWLMGRYADRAGRRAALTLSVTLMAAGSLLIAVTPSYESIGLAAPAVLVLARLVQGISLGGEYSTSATYLSEVASPGKRGFYSSFQYVTLVAGQLLALLVQIALQQFLGEQQMGSWGWRIAFATGACGALVVMWLRRTMDESESYERERAQRDAGSARAAHGTLRELLRHPRAVLTVMGLTLGGTVAFYTYTTYIQQLMVNSAGIPKPTAALINFFALLVFVVFQPLAGALSDRIGRRPLLIFFGASGTLLTVPLLGLLSETSSPALAFALMMVGLVMVTGYTSINAIVKAELFPAKVRALGVGFPYALITAIFGGTVSTIALALKSGGMESLFFWYVSGCILVSLVTYVVMPDSSRTSEIDAEYRAAEAATAPH